MSPAEVVRPHRIQDSGPHDGEFGLKFVNHWLDEATGGGVHILFAAYDCSINGRIWRTDAPNHSRYGLGVYAVAIDQMEALIDTAPRKRPPEPVMFSSDEGRQITQVIGIDVWGMGQQFRTTFYKGDTFSCFGIPVPDNYWFLRNYSKPNPEIQPAQ